MRRPGARVSAALACLAVAVTLPTLTPFDTAVTGWLEGRQHCALLTVARAVGRYTHLLSLLLVATVVVRLALDSRGSRERIVTVLLALGSGTFAVGVLKHFVQRARPAAEVLDLAGGSFPSGHVANTVLLAMALWALWRVRGALRVPVWSGLVTVIAVVATARVYEGRHWPSDVLCSASLASAYGLLAIGHPDRRWRLRTTVLVFVGAGVLGLLAREGVHLGLPSGPLHADSLVATVTFTAACEATRLGAGWSCPATSASHAGAWLRARSGVVSFSAPEGPVERLRVVMRPAVDRSRSPCRRLRVALNGRSLGERLVRPGWRGYVFDVPDGLLGRATNHLRITVWSTAAEADAVRGRRAEFREITFHRRLSVSAVAGHRGARTHPGCVPCREVLL